VSLPELPRAPGRAVLPSRGRIAAAWALATLLGLGALGGEPGISADEAAVLVGRSATEAARPMPPLAPAVAAITDAAGTRAGLSHLRAARLGTALAGALLSVLLAIAGWELAGGAAALLAPALFWLAPRHLQAGLLATPDLDVAALALGAVLAWRGALRAGGRVAAVRGGAMSGLLVGAAVLARADAWVFLVALAAHGLGAAALAARSPEDAEAGALLPARNARRGAAAALAAALAAAAGALAGWPAAGAAGGAAFLPARAAGPVRAALVPFLAIPASLLFAYAGGALHATTRIAAAARRRTPGRGASDDLLLLCAAAAPLAAAAIAGAPRSARPWLPAVPFLAVLAARAIVVAGATAWPRRAAEVVASVALLVLYPGLRATVSSFPLGTAAWNELLGGAPGAASAGLPRQDGGDAVAGLLAEVNARARPGARIWWPGVSPEAIGAYVRDGRLRADLASAAGPEQADVAVVALDGASRDAEYRAWAALRTARPSAGVYRDEVPLALVYARPGAWR